MDQAQQNTDRELWRGPDEGNGSYYADSVHVTQGGGIGMNVGGYVIVMRPKEWHSVCAEAVDLRNELDAATAECTASMETIARERERAERAEAEVERLRTKLDAALYSLCTDDYTTQQEVAADLKSGSEQLAK